jgi:hypothetical protein
VAAVSRCAGRVTDRMALLILNGVLRSAQWTQEFLVYEFLTRLNHSALGATVDPGDRQSFVVACRYDFRQCAQPQAGRRGFGHYARFSARCTIPPNRRAAPDNEFRPETLMKTNAQRYLTVLSLAPRLAPVVPDASAWRNRRRAQSGMHALFALRERDWMADLRTTWPSSARDPIR